MKGEDKHAKEQEQYKIDSKLQTICSCWEITVTSAPSDDWYFIRQDGQ